MSHLYYIGAKIQEIRKSRGLSQEQLAELTEMNFRSISRLERQQNIPTLETLDKVAKALGVSIADFLDDAGVKPKSEIIKEINSIMQKMDEKELQKFYKAIYHFYN